MYHSTLTQIYVGHILLPSPAPRGIELGGHAGPLKARGSIPNRIPDIYAVGV